MDIHCNPFTLRMETVKNSLSDYEVKNIILKCYYDKKFFSFFSSDFESVFT